MGLRIARFINLLLASTLVGNEFGTWAAVHPALATLPGAEHLRAEQAVLRRFTRIMPGLMVGTILSCLPVLALIRDKRSAAFRCTLAGTGCFIGIMNITFARNIPINQRVLAHTDEAPPADWPELRSRWNRWHTIRSALSYVGLGLLYAGVLWPTAPETRD